MTDTAAAPLSEDAQKAHASTMEFLRRAFAEVKDANPIEFLSEAYRRAVRLQTKANDEHLILMAAIETFLDGVSNDEFLARIDEGMTRYMRKSEADPQFQRVAKVVKALNAAGVDAKSLSVEAFEALLKAQYASEAKSDGSVEVPVCDCPRCVAKRKAAAESKVDEAAVDTNLI